MPYIESSIVPHVHACHDLHGFLLSSAFFLILIDTIASALVSPAVVPSSFAFHVSFRPSIVDFEAGELGRSAHLIVVMFVLCCVRTRFFPCMSHHGNQSSMSDVDGRLISSMRGVLFTITLLGRPEDSRAEVVFYF